MASCASWAPAEVVAYCLGFSDRYLSPHFSLTCCRAARMASLDNVTESVRIYVIYPFSYSPCAARIVLRDDIPRRLPAACCRVDVVNGGTGRRRYGFDSMDITVKSCPCTASAMRCASASLNTMALSFAIACEGFPSLPKSFDPAIRRPPNDTRRVLNDVSTALSPGTAFPSESLPTPLPTATVAITSQYGVRTNAIRSRSRSTISRVATDCTRPAESPVLTLRHSTGDNS